MTEASDDASSARAMPGAGPLPPRPRPRWFAPAAITAVFVLLAAFSVFNTLSARRIDEFVVTVGEMASDPQSIRWTLRAADDPSRDAKRLGVVYFQPKTGRLLVMGTALPKAPAGKTYVCWTIPSEGGAPANRGTLRPSVIGGSAVILDQAPGPADLDAVVVSLESDPRTPMPTPDAIKAVTRGG